MNVFIEIIRNVVLVFLAAYLAVIGHRHRKYGSSGWRWVVGGFALLFFGSVVGMVQQFTPTSLLLPVEAVWPALLENIIGYVAGLICVTVGLVRWIGRGDSLGRYAGMEDDLRLEKERNAELASQLQKLTRVMNQKVADRTSQLVDSNKTLLARMIEHDQMRQTLKDSQSRQQQFFDSIVDMAWIKDAQGRLIMVNQAVAEACGKERDQMIGLTNDDLLPPELADHYNETDRQVLRTGQSLTVEKEFIRSNGKKIWIEINKSPIVNSEGEVVATAGIARDITERRRLIEQVQRRQKDAERANAAKSDFLANMSHEIRTPINSIIGFSELLLDDCLTDDQLEKITLIKSSSRSLLELINDILDLSKIESGKLLLQSSDCSIEEVLNAISSLLLPQAIEKGLEFKILQCTCVPAAIYCDPLRLRQCLLNLVSNAIKFTQTGYVHIKVALENHEDMEYVAFAVEDTGVGIRADKQQDVFESFTQADSDTAHQFGGTGLGLTITHRLAKMMGGSIELNSQPGLGSTFSLLIPTGMDSACAPTIGEMQLQNFVNKPSIDENLIFTGNVLVAEDNAANRKLIELLLKKVGIVADFVHDGQQAVDALHERDYDLILMDMQMPVLNGYEAVVRIRQSGTQTPIVAITANAMLGDEKKCINVGCNGYLAKPIEFVQLVEVLKQYLPSASQKKTAEESLTFDIPEPPASAKNDDDRQAEAMLQSSLDGSADFAEVIRLFVEEIPDHIQNIQQSLQQGDWDKLKITLHTLKGESGNAGFAEIMKKTASLEGLIFENDLATLKGQVDDLNDVLQRLTQRPRP